MTDRSSGSSTPGDGEPDGVTQTEIAAIPEPERSVVEADVPRLRGWLLEHPDVRASVALDRTAFDAGQGHVLIIVTVTGDPAELHP